MLHVAGLRPGRGGCDRLQGKYMRLKYQCTLQEPNFLWFPVFVHIQSHEKINTATTCDLVLRVTTMEPSSDIEVNSLCVV
jgi:hypothetical protein